MTNLFLGGSEFGPVRSLNGQAAACFEAAFAKSGPQSRRIIMKIDLTFRRYGTNPAFGPEQHFSFHFANHIRFLLGTI
jgi:hypothetical protein